MANRSGNKLMNWTSLQNSMTGAKKRAMRALMAEYTSLLSEPPEGFVVKIDDPFSWDVGIYGPPSTPYWGGYFKVLVTFPDDYPFVPPKLKFKSRFWHPNVYHNGSVCMSILHDPHAEEIPTDLPREEKWNPTLSVRTVLLSLISIMGSPNPDSPANPEASKMYRSWLEEGDQDYVKVIQDIVRRSKKTASRDGVNVPKTLEEYVQISKPKVNEPLVAYSSDEYDSDHSELLSLPSSHDSDQEHVFDEEPTWLTVNSNLTPDQQTDLADIVQTASASISSHQRSSICKEPSNTIAESLTPMRFQANECKDGTNSCSQSTLSVLAESSFTSREVAQSVSLTSNTSNSQTPPLDMVTLTDSPTDANTETSSKDDDITSNNVSLVRGNGRIYEEASCSSREVEQSGVSEDDPLQERNCASASFNNNYLNPCREPDVLSSNPNSLSNPTSDSFAGISTTSRHNCSRKRKRPPRLYIYSQLNANKKRKRQ